MKRLIVAIALSLALAAESLAAQVEIDLYAGVSGPAAQGNVTPVTAVVRNRGRAESARLDVFLEHRRGPLVGTLPLDLPRQSNRRVQLYSRPGIMGLPVIAVLRRERETLAATTVTASGGSSVVVLLDSRMSSAAVAGANATVEHPPLWALPDAHLGYCSVASIVLGDEPLASLSPEQARAIVGYVQQGGTLMVTAGLRGPGLLTTFVGELLPGAKCEMVEVDSLDALGDRYRERMASRGPVPCAVLSGPGIEPQVLQGRVPLVAERRVMRGRVVWVGVDLGRKPMNTWSGLSRLACAWRRPGRDPARQAFRSLQRVPADPTRFTWIVLFFGGYLFCLGPLLFWLMRRLKQPLAIWAIAPVVGAAFVGLTPLIRPALSRAVGNLFTATLVERFPGSAQARVRTLGVVVSRGREAHELSLPWIEGAGLWGGALVNMTKASAEVVVSRPGRGIAFAPLPLGMWGSQSFDIEGVTERAPRVEGRVLRLAGGSWRMELHNLGLAPMPRGELLLGYSGGSWGMTMYSGTVTPRLAPGERRVADFGRNAMVTPKLLNWPPLIRTVAGSNAFWVKGCAAWVVADASSAGSRALDVTMQGRLGRLPWPTIQCGRFLDHKLDHRTFVAWLPIKSAAGHALAAYGSIERHTHRETERVRGKRHVWFVQEFRLPSRTVVVALRVRVRYEDWPRGYAVQVYNCAAQSWEPLHFGPAKVLKRAKRSWEKPVMARGAALGGPPGRYVQQPGGIVTLRENREPRSRGFGRFDHEVQIEAQLRGGE